MSAMGWDYMPFIGRQVNKLTIGVIGYGRLGTLFAHYCNSFGAKVLVYDPYKDVVHVNIEQVRNMEQLFSQCDDKPTRSCNRRNKRVY